jgi:uncharacterized protein YyaL (SSP411 family)
MKEKESSRKSSNRLADSNSPYLLQHVDNPVAWSPWGKSAFQKAQKEDKPFFAGKDSEQMIVHSKEIYDGATPSGNSVALMNLMRLARMTGDTQLEANAEQVMGAFSAQVISHPAAFTQFLAACDFIIGPAQEIAINMHEGKNRWQLK